MSSCNCADEPLYQTWQRTRSRSRTQTDRQNEKEMWQPLGKYSKYYCCTRPVCGCLLWWTTRSWTMKRYKRISTMRKTMTRGEREEEKQKKAQIHTRSKMFGIIRLNKAELLLITKDTIVSCSRSFYPLSYFCLRSPKRKTTEAKKNTRKL